MTDLVKPQPGFLQQIVGMAAAHILHHKKPMQRRAELVHQRRGRRRIAALISNHQHLQAPRPSAWEMKALSQL